MIINQDKLEYICELIVNKNPTSGDTKFTDSDSLYHIRAKIPSGSSFDEWYIAVYKESFKIMKVAYAHKIEIMVDRFNKTQPILMLEDAMRKCIDTHISKSDEAFINIFPDYKERLRDHKIETINN